jgi:hypothetical protein
LVLEPLRCCLVAMAAVNGEQVLEMMGQLQAQLEQSNAHVTTLSAQLETLRSASDHSITELRASLQTVTNMQKDKKKKMKLGGLKNLEPGSFDGRKDESYKAWAKSVKSYCEHDTEGFREALEWAENEAAVIDADTVELMSWEHAQTANKQLYNLLESLCVLDALVQVEKTKGLGFEAWRALKNRHNPSGGRFELDRLRAMLGRTVCKSLDELPAAADRLERDFDHYASTHKEPLPESM